MSISTKSAFSWTLAAGSLLLFASTVAGQRFQPFAPMEIGDYQWFAPPEIERYDGDFVPAKTGLFFTYDRAALTVSRPDVFGPLDVDIGAQVLVDEDSGTDPTWANRYAFGYMNDDDHGWSATVWEVENPAKKIVVDTVLRDAVFPSNITRPTVIRGIPPIEVGLLPTSTNDIRVWSVELNKVWRLPVNRRGFVLEPFAGPRFVNARDRWNTRQFEVDLAPPGLISTTFTEREEVIDFDYRTNNKMVGGQLGLRCHARRGRWILASEIRGFAMHNFQDVRIKVDGMGAVQDITFDDTGNATNGLIMNSFRDEFTTDHTNRFVTGGELKLDVSYELTKKIAIRVGGEVAHFEGGVGRGRGSRQDLTLAGVLFGFTVNR